MSHSHSSAERDRSSIKVSASELDIDALIASLDSDGEPELRDSLQNASVLIIPSDLRPEYEGPAFPEISHEVLEHLKDGLRDHTRVEAAASDEDYAEFSYRSEDIILPTLCVVDRFLLPIVLSCLASFIYDRLKRRGCPEAEGRVKCDVHFFKSRDETRLSLIRYDGPADTFERAISQALQDSESLLEDEGSGNHERGNSPRGN